MRVFLWSFVALAVTGCTTTGDEPATPLIAPPMGSNSKPGGSSPETIDQAKGGAPPVAMMGRME